MRPHVLQVVDLSKSFSSVAALQKCSFSIREGRALGVVGANGSGKTTLINTLTGFLKPDSGSVIFKNSDLTGTPPHHIYRAGVVRTFQAGGAHRNLSLDENLSLSVWRSAAELARTIFLAKGAVELVTAGQLRANAGNSMPVRSVTGLVGELSFGQARLVELNRALLTSSSLIIFDEPTAGLDRFWIDCLIRIVERNRQRGRSFLIVEHNMAFVRATCQEVLALDRGTTTFRGAISDFETQDGTSVSI